MNLRRTLATAAAGLALIAALAACGFNYPTDRINNITAGANDRDGTVDVLNAAIVSKADDLGTFVATFVNTSQTQQISVTSMTGDGTAVGQIAVEPFPINPKGLVNLATERRHRGPGHLLDWASSSPCRSTSTTARPPPCRCRSSLDDGQWAGLDTATPSPTSSPSDTSPSDTSSPSARRPLGHLVPERLLELT